MKPVTSRFPLAVLATLAFGLTAATSRATLVFDNVTNGETSTSGGSLTATGTTPNTFMGDGYTLAPGTADITGFDAFPYNNTGTTFTGLKITIFVWGSVNTGTVNATTPAFGSLLGSYVLTSTDTFTSGSYYRFETGEPGATPSIALTTPLTLPGTTVGITFNFQGTTDGINYASANNLTSIISYGSAPTVGTNVFNGYYRNAASETNGNFTSTLRSLGLTNQSVALRIFGDIPAAGAPEPGTWAMIALGAGALFAWRGFKLPARRR